MHSLVEAALANLCINLTNGLSRAVLAHGPRQPASPAALADYAEVIVVAQTGVVFPTPA